MGDTQVQQNNTEQTNVQEPATFSAEYVHELREEAKGYRTKLKSTEAAIRSGFGLGDDADLSDIAALFAAQKTAADKALETSLAEYRTKANAHAVRSAIRSLDGYDHKLVEKLIDTASITVGDDFAVDGAKLKEAVEALEKEYPAIKTQKAPVFTRAVNAGAKKPTKQANAEFNDKLRAAFGR